LPAHHGKDPPIPDFTRCSQPQWRAKPTKTYRGTARNSAVTVGVDGHPVRPLDYRLDLINHSPTGFAWGYEGSGPAQLALALCALQVYQEFNRRVVAGLPQRDDWIISDTVVRAICAPLLGPAGRGREI
jgi:Family of unknown function (DUF6166)